MSKLFFSLSGEHLTLPVSELKAILETEGYTPKKYERLDQLLRVETDLGCIDAVRHRAALTRLCGRELFSCEAETNDIVTATDSVDFKQVLREKESFAVRVKRIKSYASNIDGMTLEKKIGEIILNNANEAKVKLKNPDKTFIGILTNRIFIFGVKLAEIQTKPFFERRPMRKPFFHPSAMQAKLARCMVNLAKPKTGDLVFDPFCGTGSMLIEAAMIGCRVLASDIKKRMAKGTLQNLNHFSIKNEGILVADARSMPIAKIDCAVTDPPYGRSATTLKRTTKQIVEEVLMSLHDVLRNGRRVCMAAPRTINVGQIGEASGYKHLESHFVHVHRSLTREIAVFEKV